MKGRVNGARLLAVLLVCAVAGAAGCANVATYLEHRYNDLCEVADVGLTITDTPQWGLYWNSLDVFPIGVSHLDGWFVGFGGGQIGITRHYNRCWGLGYGEEIIGWGSHLGEVGEVDESSDKVIKTRSGWIGIATWLLGIDVTDSGFDLSPNYRPACVHFVPHIAYVGFVWNARYFEFIDAMLGFFTLDPSGDDGYDAGKWSFPWRVEAEEVEVEAKSNVKEAPLAVAKVIPFNE